MPLLGYLITVLSKKLRCVFKMKNFFVCVCVYVCISVCVVYSCLYVYGVMYVMSVHVCSNM